MPSPRLPAVAAEEAAGGAILAGQRHPDGRGGVDLEQAHVESFRPQALHGRFAAHPVARSRPDRHALVGAGNQRLRADFLRRAFQFGGAAIGATIYAFYSLQTSGLLYVNSTKSAFITAFYVPLAPLLQWLFLRKCQHPMAWLAVAVVFV